jgi:hypothetical protein
MELNQAQNIAVNCPKCEKSSENRDEVEKLFGFRNMDGFIRSQSWCRNCRKIKMTK